MSLYVYANAQPSWVAENTHTAFKFSSVFSLVQNVDVSFCIMRTVLRMARKERTTAVWDRQLGLLAQSHGKNQHVSQTCLAVWTHWLETSPRQC